MSVNLALLQNLGDRFYNAFTLVDLTKSDQPLVYVNRAFEELTGFPSRDIIGRNCRFLQGPETDPEDVLRIRKAIAGSTAVFCDLLNYRKNGQTFYNRLVLLPLEVDGRSHFIGMQTDATALLADSLAAGKTFNEMKTSELIRDRINTPLMTIVASCSMKMNDAKREEILTRSFSKILETIKTVPYRR